MKNRMTEWNREHTHGQIVKGDGYTELCIYEDFIEKLVSDEEIEASGQHSTEILKEKIEQMKDTIFMLQGKVAEYEGQEAGKQFTFAELKEGLKEFLDDKKYSIGTTDLMNLEDNTYLRMARHLWGIEEPTDDDEFRSRA